MVKKPIHFDVSRVDNEERTAFKPLVNILRSKFDKTPPLEEVVVNEENFMAQLTDPAQHDPNNFCYIVHGINPSAKHGLLMTAMMTGGYDFSQEIDLLYSPGRISEKKIISTSIINQGHLSIWGDAFYILDVPWSNHVSMSPRDRATNITNPDGVLSFAREPYALPSQLIRETQFSNDGSYNEVVVTGNSDGNLVKIIGVGIKRKDVGDGKIVEPNEAWQMRKYAKSKGLPIVEIVEKSRIEDGPARIIHYGPYVDMESMLAISNGGFRYIFKTSNSEGIDVFRSDKNIYRGRNEVKIDEYLQLRPRIMDALKVEKDYTFLKRIDDSFGLSFPRTDYIAKS